ncbi:hypothetical protein A6X21_11170 [Planctopirus hydrillae]|uniref:Uncharacterized protein n=1 Tax=Planctopirus hydrillae TaxID=1841610 RepID=A0A1C3E6K5_9PLAN|nr:hypothetical protein A6X21_11170 [Planctopirus hydrillae]
MMEGLFIVSLFHGTSDFLISFSEFMSLKKAMLQATSRTVGAHPSCRLYRQSTICESEEFPSCFWTPLAF